MDKKFYEEPCMELLYVEVERGFEASNDDLWGYPGENPDENEFGPF